MSRTRLFMTTIIIGMTLWDLVAVSFLGNDDASISASISKWFQSLATYPMITIGIGYLLGHFFGWMNPAIPQGKQKDLLKLASDMRKYGVEQWAVRVEQIVGK